MTTTEKRIATRRTVSKRAQIEMVLYQFLGYLAAIGLGVIFMSTVLFTDAEFWANVAKFWGTK